MEDKRSGILQGRFGNNHASLLSECLSYLDGIPHQFLQAFLELVYQSGGGF